MVGRAVTNTYGFNAERQGRAYIPRHLNLRGDTLPGNSRQVVDVDRVDLNSRVPAPRRQPVPVRVQKLLTLRVSNSFPVRRPTPRLSCPGSLSPAASRPGSRPR